MQETAPIRCIISRFSLGGVPLYLRAGEKRKPTGLTLMSHPAIFSPHFPPAGLANFSANVFKKYPIELTGLLQYVANQLKAAKRCVQ